MNLLAPYPDPRIPLSILLLSLARSARLQLQLQATQAAAKGDDPSLGNEIDWAQEEPERWDGMS